MVKLFHPCDFRGETYKYEKTDSTFKHATYVYAQSKNSVLRDTWKFNLSSSEASTFTFIIQWDHSPSNIIIPFTQNLFFMYVFFHLP